MKEENLRKTVEDCSNSHRQFENKVSELSQEFRELKHSTEHLFSSNTLILTDLELKIKERQKFITEQKSIMQTLRFSPYLCFSLSLSFNTTCLVTGFLNIYYEF